MRIEALVGQQIRQERKKQGLRQEDVCDIIHKQGGKIRREYLSQIERGLIKNIRINTIHQISKALGVKIYKLFSTIDVYAESEIFKPDAVIEIDKIMLRQKGKYNIKIWG